eukprot:1142002-Pelagomonas_calceolata.AAC.1
MVGSILSKQRQSVSIMSGKAKGTSKANERPQDVQVTPASFLQQAKQASTVLNQLRLTQSARRFFAPRYVVFCTLQTSSVTLLHQQHRATQMQRWLSNPKQCLNWSQAYSIIQIGYSNKLSIHSAVINSGHYRLWCRAEEPVPIGKKQFGMAREMLSGTCIR